MAQALKFAVLGDPIEHSLSPAIHTAFGQQLGLDVDYTRVLTPLDELPDRLKALAEAGLVGVNLTVPLKGAGIRLCRTIDAAARRARAVNTLRRQDGAWSGHNTDGAGLMLDLERLAIPISGRRVLILGAGGATAGILDPLLAAEPAEVMVVNRTAARAVELAEGFAHLGPIDGGGLDESAGSLRDFDVLIQATSAGHAGQLPPLRRGWLARNAWLYDLNYGPAHGGLRRWADAFDLPCHDGLGMLVGQAALAFEIWTGQRPGIESVIASLSSG
jgi:shikimate dehydrogenase